MKVPAGGHAIFADSLLVGCRTGEKNGLNFGGGTTCFRTSTKSLVGEVGLYGNRTIAFLSLSDSIQSKETERESDWQDITILEEIRDARNIATVGDGPNTVDTLSQLRSRKGLELALHQSMFRPGDDMIEAYARSTSA